MILTADQRVAVLRQYGGGCPWFVETGTADGYTTAALIPEFDRLITIELDADRYRSVAAQRFLHEPKVLPLLGDSAEWLCEIVHVLTEPTLFWLDAHYSGGTRGDVDTPVRDELDMIGRATVPTVVMIDDARMFGNDPAYPTQHDITMWAARHHHRCETRHDIIRLTPIGVAA